MEHSKYFLGCRGGVFGSITTATTMMLGSIPSKRSRFVTVGLFYKPKVPYKLKPTVFANNPIFANNIDASLTVIYTFFYKKKKVFREY